MKRDSFNVLFFIKKAKLLKNGEASVCMRITVNGARVENNMRKSIEPALWNQAEKHPEIVKLLIEAGEKHKKGMKIKPSVCDMM